MSKTKISFLISFLARDSIYAERAICYHLSISLSVGGSVKNSWWN